MSCSFKKTRVKKESKGCIGKKLSFAVKSLAAIGIDILATFFLAVVILKNPLVAKTSKSST